MACWSFSAFTSEESSVCSVFSPPQDTGESRWTTSPLTSGLMLRTTPNSEPWLRSPGWERWVNSEWTFHTDRPAGSGWGCPHWLSWSRTWLALFPSPCLLSMPLHRPPQSSASFSHLLSESCPRVLGTWLKTGHCEHLRLLDAPGCWILSQSHYT